MLTSRLLLSRPSLADFDDSFALWSNPQVTRYIGGSPANRQEVWARLLRYAGLWQLLGFGYWTVCRRDDNQFIGEVGVADFHRPLLPSIHGLAEAGWVIYPCVQGQGYAQEAVTAALGWMQANFPDKPVVCIVSPENSRSIKLAKKVGFEHCLQPTYPDKSQTFITGVSVRFLK